MFDIESIKKKLSKNYILNKIIFFKKIESTNKFLKERNFSSGTIILAEKQSGSYGKLGVKWYSPKGGLWFSFVINKKIKKPYKYLMTVSVAVVKTLRTYKIKALIKKPNDILIDGKKVCGILLENDFYIGKVVVGVGLNVNNKVPSNTNIPAISIKQTLKKKIDLNEIFVRLIGVIDKYLKKDKNTIDKYWKKYLIKIF
ncbi:MAG: biotin--[acetyl-CoA-carboxylase] ligase [Candidatus Goldbacteria bacterium]|nr:biotin--[acetyl-CoA-carboxylase] ligase [Candidatus Goldiibacteriota bacterium]